MQLWKLTLAYDGTDFHGWQVQPQLRTIQGTLAEAIRNVTGEIVLPQGSGRTDAGVHALGQVASVALAAPIPPANLQRALNRALPASIRVLAADFAPNLGVETPFHARHSALRKTYEYRIFPRVAGFSETQPDLICPPTLAPYVWDCPWPIDLVLANRAAAAVLGEHDFASFAASDPDATQREGQPAPGTIRRIFASHWQRIPQAPGQPDLLIYRVTGTGFLHNMVRILVGTFVDIAAGRIAPDVIPDILAARRRSAAGPTAPARGLFLLHVEYPHATAAPQPAPAEAHA